MAPILSETDLASLGAMAVSVFLKDTCDILRNPDQAVSTAIPDGQGGYTGASSSTSIGWQATSSGVACAVVEATAQNGAEPLQASQLQSKSSKTLLLPRFTDIRDSDRVRVYHANSTIVYYEVISITEPLSYEVVRRVFVERQGQGVR
jgi:hypothetical protein